MTLRQRLPAEWALKLIGIPVFMAVFFAAYFLVLRHPVRPVTVMPLTLLDQLIEFEPGALLLYTSLWVFVLLPPALIGERRELMHYAIASGWLAFTGLLIFLLWPTSVPTGDFAGSDHWAVHYLKQIDATGNACPSLHVAFAVFTAVWLGWLLRDLGASDWLNVLSWCWCLGILYSTMATRQHVAIDVLAGALLGGVTAWAFRRGRRSQRPSEAIIASG